MTQATNSPDPRYRNFLFALQKEVAEHLHKESYTVEDLAYNLGMSRSQIHRKLKASTGKNITQYIREARLKKGLELLHEEDVTVSEVAYRVGFSSPSYFSKCFSQEYGYPPAEVGKQRESVPIIKQVAVEPEEHPVPEVEALPAVDSRPTIPLLSLALGAGGVLLLLVVGWWMWSVNSAANATEIGQTLAVLPFSNLTASPEEAYLVDGVHEAIISELHRAGIPVIPRTSMMAYKGQNKRVKDISYELGVKTLIEGAVFRRGNVLSVEIRLIDGETESYLWSDNFEEEIQDVFSLYKDATRSIAEEIELVLSPEAIALLEEKRIMNPEAYELYLKGRFHANLGGDQDIQDAISYYNRAIDLDPDMGMAYSGLVENYLLLGFGHIDPFDAYTGFRLAAEKALELDISIASNHHLLAMIKIFSNWDWIGAEEELKQVILANPHASAGYDSYCQFLWAMGRTGESVLAGEQAVATDPKDHFAQCDLAYAYYYAGDIEASRQQLRTMIDSFGMDCLYHFFLHHRIRISKAKMEELPSILEELEQMHQEGSTHELEISVSLALIHLKMGNPRVARQYLKEIEDLAEETFVDPWYYAHLYLSLGEKEKAYQLLERGVYQRSFLLLYTLKSDPWFDPLREDIRFQNLLRQMKLPAKVEG